MTKIEWTDKTWNPIAAFDKATGKRGWYCAHVSPGCVHCYAEKMNTWRGNRHLYRVPSASKVDIRVVDRVLAQPLAWRTPRRIFVCSMTDLFLDEHTDDMIDRVFATMAAAPQHVFQVLTKRAERMRDYVSMPGRAGAVAGEMGSGTMFPFVRADDLAARWPLTNVWCGVSVENQQYADERIPSLLDTPASIRFLSCEPLLGPVDLERVEIIPDRPTRCGIRVNAFTSTHVESGIPRTARGIDWVITGGESGPGARPCDLDWITSLVADCDLNGVACFVKQLGAVPMQLEGEWRKYSRRLLNANNRNRVPDGFVPLKLNDSHGGDMSEWPEELRVRQFPTPSEATV